VLGGIIGMTESGRLLDVDADLSGSELGLRAFLLEFIFHTKRQVTELYANFGVKR
jgi:hypothetical protein